LQKYTWQAWCTGIKRVLAVQYLVDIQLARQYILDFFFPHRIKNAFTEVLHRHSDCVELPNTRIDNNDSDMLARL
jgi:hypothetical protein